jgi:hypothetical protein
MLTSLLCLIIEGARVVVLQPMAPAMIGRPKPVMER